MTKLGLKLWSINTHYVSQAAELYAAGFCDYIELSSIPESFAETVSYWKDINVPYVIHAPHFMQGLNFSLPEQEAENFRLAEEAFRFADALKAEKIIFHPGILGNCTEAARQMKKLNDKRVIVENKPYKVTLSNNEAICVGYSPEQIEYIMESADIGFCLDIGHCFCAANGLGTDKYDFMKQFLALKPTMFHISDGEIDGAFDKHYNIDKGSYDFKKIFSLLPENRMITLETEKTSKTDLNDFKADIIAIKRYD